MSDAPRPCPACYADGRCSEHDRLVAAFRELLDSPSPVGFDAIRDRWTRGYNLLFGR